MPSTDPQPACPGRSSTLMPFTRRPGVAKSSGPVVLLPLDPVSTLPSAPPVAVVPATANTVAKGAPRVSGLTPRSGW